MNIQFFGAAQTVTGSCFIVETKDVRFAIDCGMHQGNSEMEERNRSTSSYRASDLDFILLTHAHIDHSGLLPKLVKEGFNGKIYCTQPTAELIGILLPDSAHIQAVEATWTKKKNLRHSGTFASSEEVNPLYTVEDALKVIPLCQPVQYETPFKPCESVTVTFRDAGHILGSAMVRLDVCENGKTSSVLFTGDIGRPGTLLMHDPCIGKQPETIIMESTYGDRDHKNESDTLNDLSEAIHYSYKYRDKVIIPAFAVGRTQEILYCLYLLAQDGRLPDDMPIYVDSPLAIEASKIFEKYRNMLDTPELTEILASSKMKFPNIQFTKSVKESQQLNESDGPAIIIAASGMCNAGRIRHHLRHNAWRKSVSLVFVGFQAMGTPGRRIIDGTRSLHLFGETVAISCRVFTIGGFSAHAGQSQLLEWLGQSMSKSTNVILVHGEEKTQKILAKKIEEQFGIVPKIPGYMECIEIIPHDATYDTTKDEQKIVSEVKTVSDAHKPKKVDFSIILADTEAKFALVKAAIEKIEKRTHEEQIELRDRLVELNGEILSLLTEI